MSGKNVFSISIPFILVIVGLLTVTVAQPGLDPETGQVRLGDVRGTVVTLYYYDAANQGKGAIVPLPGGQNPQEVVWDANVSAPGTYTFYKVPFGTYYIEAVHDGQAWFAIATVGEGTTTANVAIPPNGTARWQPVTPIPSPTAAPSVTAVPISPTPSPSPVPSPAPGLTTAFALAGLLLVALYAMFRGK